MHRLSSAAFVAVACLLLAAPRLPAGPVSFRNDVMAVLSKAGCNAGACHGNQNGKGGLKLSLRGDLRGIVQEYVPVLGFTPVVRTSGPVDSAVPQAVAEQLLAVLREALSNVARPSYRVKAMPLRVEPSRPSWLAGTCSNTHCPAAGSGPM